MKLLVLTCLLATTAVYSASIAWSDGLTAQSQYQFITVPHATTTTSFITAMKNIYTQHGDPAESLEGLKFLETAFELWRNRFNTSFSYTYNTFLQETGSPATQKSPGSADGIKKNLTPTEFTQQLTQHVNQSLSLLQNTLQDPILSKVLTSAQKKQLQNSISTTSTKLGAQ